MSARHTLSRRAPLAAIALSVTLGSALAACSEDERVDGIPIPHLSAAPASSHPAKPTTPPKRTVTTRNPFGNVAASENLLWDGDFEWSSPFTDQYGWIEPPANPTISDVVVGAACKSGVKCARVKKSKALLGIAVSSTKPFLKASVFVRFEDAAGQPATECAKAAASLLDEGGLALPDADVDLAPTSPTPAADGWCELVGTSPMRSNKTYFYVRNHSTTTMLIDDAVLLATETAPAELSAPKSLHAAESEADLAEARQAIRDTRLPQDGRPNPARDAFEAHQRSR